MPETQRAADLTLTHNNRVFEVRLYTLLHTPKSELNIFKSICLKAASTHTAGISSLFLYVLLYLSVSKKILFIFMKLLF